MAAFRFKVSLLRVAPRARYARLRAASVGLPEHVDCAIDQQTAWWIAQSTWCAPGG
jgi:hypothetical protein